MMKQPKARQTECAAIAFVVATLLIATRIEAKQMFSFDLQSLASMSTAVVEGDVTEFKVVNYVDVLTVKVTRDYAGDIKAGQSVVVGLSAFRKQKDGLETERFAVGDTLILFLQPATQEKWKQDGIPYWPAGSGVKLIANGHVTGMRQMENPGPYENTVDEGDAEPYREKVVAAVEWTRAFEKELATKKSDPAWLLEQLKARPELKDSEGRDSIAIALCEALAATGNADAIHGARELRNNDYERQLLDRPPAQK